MKSNTHIFVLRLKEIIYTLLFFVFAAILILLLIFMFKNKSHSKPTFQNISEYVTDGTPVYNPGIYTSSILLGQYAVDVVVTVDENQLKRVELNYLDEAVETMYPLLGNTATFINDQLSLGVSLENIQGDAYNQYTLKELIFSINHTLEKALD